MAVTARGGPFVNPSFNQWLRDSDWLNHPSPSAAQNYGQGLEAQNALSNAAQNFPTQGQLNAAWQSLQASQVRQPRVTAILTAFPLTALANVKIDKCVAQLPLRLAQKITSISLASEDNDLFFVVRYANDREIRFNEVDEFPTDADIARIALESTI